MFLGCNHVTVAIAIANYIAIKVTLKLPDIKIMLLKSIKESRDYHCYLFDYHAQFELYEYT